MSDLFGEKLNGNFVATVVNRVVAQQGIQARFFLMAPVIDANGGTSYALFLEANSIPNPTQLRLRLEKELAENCHYAHCRHLGQLSPARLFEINQDCSKSGEEFLSRNARARTQGR